MRPFHSLALCFKIAFAVLCIAGIINENWNKWTSDIGNELINAINQIETILRQDNVRVRDHPRLGIPILPQAPQIRKILKRLENAVHVLCILTDIIAGGQGLAVTQEETQSVVDAEGILDLLMNNLMATFSPSSCGAETE